MSVREQVKRVLTQKENRRYEKLLARKRVTYAQWLAAREEEWGREVSEKPERFGEKAEFTLFKVGRGILAENAIKNINRYFIAHPEVQLLYGDEDVWEAGEACVEKKAPWFKPDWSPDLFDDCFYFGSLVAVRRELAERMLAEGAVLADYVEGAACYRVEELADFQRWIYRCICAAGGYVKGCGTAVGHLNRIVFHADSEGEQRRFLQETAFSAQRRQEDIRDFWDGVGGDKTTVSTVVSPTVSPIVSVIVPSKDNPEILEKCLRAVERTAEGLPLEILVVDNGSSPENQRRVTALKQDLINDGVKIDYIYHPMEFNFSAMCNMGAKAAEGELLLFLNDDVELVQPESLWEMAALADRPYTGAVGLKLLYPDSGLIQHDGVVNLSVGPVHKLQFHDDSECYYYGRNRFNHNCAAVTGACLMVEKSKFWTAGGFPESLRVAYNDVELGFKLWELGYHNVVVNHFHARHHESLSRGSDESPEKRERLEEERELLYQMHPAFRGNDPYYPPGLECRGLDSRIVPAYVASGNRVQESGWKRSPWRLEELRRDECLMVRIETSGPEFIQGYSVVLWDNNACYDKYLLLIPEEAGTGAVCMRTEGQYRQDLEENLFNQKNVALGGFCVNRQGENLRPGSYRIAMLAVNRVTGAKLWNESGKNLRVKS